MDIDALNKESKSIGFKFVLMVVLSVAMLGLTVGVWLMEGSVRDFHTEMTVLLVFINLVWYWMLWSVGVSRSKAVRQAVKAIADLQKFKLATDGGSDHIVITNKDGVIEYANYAAEKMTGYTVKEMIGNRPSLWGKQMPETFYKEFWKTIKEDKKPYWGEIKNKRKTGEVYDAEVHVTPILSESNEVLFYVGIEKDITKVKTLEKMKSEFVSLASHQLRTPLSAVKWFARMLLDGDAGKLSEAQADFVSKINESNNKEIELINSLLNVSRIEAGRIPVDLVEHDLESLVRDTVDEVQKQMSDKKRMIVVEVEKKIGKVKLDKELTRQVLINLVSNAFRYTNENGVIEVKLRRGDDQVVFEVWDDGIGIPVPEQDRIFEKFYRGTNAVKKETEGSGLGLYLCKTIVESSGGKLWFVSKPGEKTLFAFSLPYEEKQ